MRTVDYAEAAEAAALPKATRLGPVRLTVTDLARSVAFYESVLGLSVQWQGRTTTEEPAVALGSAGDEAAIVLVENPSARPPGRTSGLYHVAVRYADRADLAHLVRRISDLRTPVQGASDHGTHEAIYLPDPDGNGLELHSDRPREAWSLSMIEEFSRGGPQPLDVEALVAVSAGESTTRTQASGVDIGHLHLHVGSTRDAFDFYRSVIGFALTADIGSAIFMSAGGYHHHLGANVWQGPGAPPAALDAIGLRRWSVVVPSGEDLAAAIERAEQAPGAAFAVDDDGALIARDPSGNTVVIETEAQRAAADFAHERPTPPLPAR